MNSQNSDEQIDAWTGMPVEFEDVDFESVTLFGPVTPTAKPQATVEPLAEPSNKLMASAEKKKSLWNITDLFWKLLAASSESTSPSVLACLSTDQSNRVRRRVAENLNCPPDAIALLTEDADIGVRSAIAKNPMTPAFLLRKLASDAAVDVRFAIASNREMPDAILLSLFLDPDPMVASRASQTLAA